MFHYCLELANRKCRCADIDCPDEIILKGEVRVTRRVRKEETEHEYRKFYHVPCVMNSLSRMHADTPKILSVDDLQDFEYAKPRVKRAIRLFLSGTLMPWLYEDFRPNDIDTWFLEQSDGPKCYREAKKRRLSNASSPHSEKKQRITEEDEDGYYDEYLDGYEDEEVDIPDVVSPIAQIPQTTAKRIKSVFSDQQHEILKSKIPILYKDCPLLNPVDRDQILKFIIGQPHDLPPSKTLEFLMDRKGTSSIYFTLNTESKAWSKIVK